MNISIIRVYENMETELKHSCLVSNKNLLYLHNILFLQVIKIYILFRNVLGSLFINLDSTICMGKSV